MKRTIVYASLLVLLSNASLIGKADSAGIGNALVGPLFYTPLERDAIDRGNLAVPGDGDSTGQGNQDPPEILRFDGRVERSAGRSTAWVSGRPLERLRPRLPDARLRLQGERLRIDTPESTRWLRAGESFEPEQSEPPQSAELKPETDQANGGAAPAR
ncbi:MAG: hypothetical protein AB8C46_09230 [Burkholderiaceae bacterium]